MLAGYHRVLSTLVQVGNPDTCNEWGQRLHAPNSESFVLSQRLPNAHLHIYPDSGYGHCFQFPNLYAKHVGMFLDDDWRITDLAVKRGREVHGAIVLGYQNYLGRLDFKFLSIRRDRMKNRYLEKHFIQD
jgi:hypothetical protein